MAHLLWEVKNELISATVKRIAEISGPLDVIEVEYNPESGSTMFLFECDDNEEILSLNNEGEVLN